MAILVILLIAAVVFGVWAFKGRQDYKDNSDARVAAAVDAAKKTQAAQLQAQFDQQSKAPYKVFTGSATYGSITFNYPKTWSAYVDTTSSSEPINGYFHPGVVPGAQSNTAFALRLELVNTDYSQVIQQMSSGITQDTVTAKAYTPPKLNGVANVQAGTLFTGQINQQDSSQNGTMLVIKVRDKTMEIYTESNNYLSDFNNIIMPSLTFAP